MNTKKSHIIITALKIAIGSSLAILIATFLNLDYASSAGTITLLTLMNTKKGSLRLAGRRIITYLFSMAVGTFAFLLVPQAWLSFGIYIFLSALLAYALGWSATLSVNAVIGTHLLLDDQPGAEQMLNELVLVLIGISLAVLLNLFDDYRHQRQGITYSMQNIEKQIQTILESLAVALETNAVPKSVDSQLDNLLTDIQESLHFAYQYQDNTFQTHPVYYIDYFEMRRSQRDCLLSIRNDIQRCPAVPDRAEEVAQFLRDVIPSVTQWNDLQPLMDLLNNVFNRLRDDTPPLSADAFERRTVQYHILLEMEQFLKLNQDFVKKRSNKELKKYRASSLF